VTATAAASMSARTAGQLRGWLSVRHSLRTEAAAVLALYGLYELARGVVVGNSAAADRHARRLVALERSLHLFVEANVQRAAHDLTGLTSLLGISYLTLHLGVTAALLLWLHRRRPAAFPRVRTTLLLASGLSLIGFLVYPTAPPRLAGIGIVDTVSNGHVDLNHGLVSALYNPYAAVPSMHFGYALIVAATLLRHGRHLVVRTLGSLYPPFVLLVIVATGNHFFLDAAIGAITAALAAALALVVTRKPTSGRVTRLRERPPPFHERHGIAA
jgi:PAP2 superfamily